MFCHSCGKEIKQGNAYCVHCGNKVSVHTTQYAKVEKDPYNSPSGKLALVFGILGIVGLLFCGVLSFFSIPALVISTKQLKEYPKDERLKAGKVMGLIGVILLAITLIMVVILVSKYMKNIDFSQLRRYR